LKRGISLLLVIFMLMGCIGLVACGEKQSVTTEEIVARVIETLDEINTCHFDVDTTASSTVKFEGDEFETATNMNSSGVLDQENTRMQMDSAMNMEVPGEGEMAAEMEVYVLGGTSYMMIKKPGTDSTWMRSNILTVKLRQISQIEYQEVYLNASEVTVTGSETVGGIDCYVLQVTPNIEQTIEYLWPLSIYQLYPAEIMLGWEQPAAYGASPMEMLRDYSVKQWIAKDTYFIVKAEIDIDYRMVMIGGSEVETHIATRLFYDSYNQPVSIELPEEADNAPEMSAQ